MNVVVVGAGVGGLAAAARLAAGGHRVDVFERTGEPGGFCRGYESGGYRFDTGPSLLVWPQTLRELFADTGGGLPLELRPAAPPAYRFAGPGPPGGAGPAEAAGSPGGRPAPQGGGLLDPAGEPEWAALMAHAARLWRAVGEPVLSRPAPGPAALARLAASRPADLLRVAPWRSLRALGRARLADPRLRLVLDRYATYAGADPRRAPAVLAVIPYLEQHGGCWHVSGGLQAIPAALAARVRERGGRLHLGREVARILHAAGRVRGVALAGGERVAADVVVTDVAEQVVRERLLAARPPRRPPPPSVSGFTVLLALRGPAGLPHHLVSFPADYDREFDEVFSGRPARDPAIYACCPDDPAMHPAGGRAVRLLVNAPPQSRFDWRAPGVADRYAEHLLERLARRGLDLRERLDWWQVRTPADLQEQSGAPGGAIYGRAAHGLSGLRRPGNRTGLAGLYRVGGTVHPGGGLPLVLTSARIVAALIGPA